jgi:uronate dehydrogenase
VRVLLTGAAGIVGTALRPFLSASNDEILLTDLQPIGNLQPNERFEGGDLVDPELANVLLRQVDALVHLGGLVGPDYTFEEVLGPNVVGTYNLLRGAQQHGVKTVVYASSHHAVGFLPRGAHIDAQTPPRADSYYGVSKAFGEILAAYFADKHGLNVLSIRIGYLADQAIDERRTHTWSSPRDLAQLVQIGLTRPSPGYRLVYGVSNCPAPFFDNRGADEIGYHPQDNALDFLSDPSLRDAVADPASPESLFVGGHFASSGLSEEMLQRLIPTSRGPRRPAEEGEVR